MKLNDIIQNGNVPFLYKIILSTTQGQVVSYVTNSVSKILADIEIKKYITFEPGTVKIVSRRIQDPHSKQVSTEILGNELEGFFVVTVECIMEIRQLVRGTKDYDELVEIISQLANVKSGIIAPSKEIVVAG